MFPEGVALCSVDSVNMLIMNEDFLQDVDVVAPTPSGHETQETLHLKLTDRLLLLKVLVNIVRLFKNT